MALTVEQRFTIQFDGQTWEIEDQGSGPELESKPEHVQFIWDGVTNAKKRTYYFAIIIEKGTVLIKITFHKPARVSAELFFSKRKDFGTQYGKYVAQGLFVFHHQFNSKKDENNRQKVVVKFIENEKLREVVFLK